jgi:hypothetical protein
LSVHDPLPGRGAVDLEIHHHERQSSVAVAPPAISAAAMVVASNDRLIVFTGSVSPQYKTGRGFPRPA